MIKEFLIKILKKILKIRSPHEEWMQAVMEAKKNES